MHRKDGLSGHAVDCHGTAVRGRDRLHDGQPETGGAGGTGARGVAAREPLEHMRQQVGRDALSVVLHVHAQPRAAPLHARGDGRPGRGVRTGVGQQVHQDLLQPGRVRRHQRGLVGQVEPPVVVPPGGARVADGVHDEGYEVGLVELERPTRVEAGEQEEILDEQGHTPRLGLDPPERVPGVRPGLLASTSRQLGVSADRRQRRTQLMTGVRDELTYAHLALLARVQGAVHMVEHPVECRADLADLGVRVGLGLGDPLVEGHLAGVQREFGDPGGGRGDLAEGPQSHSDQDRTGDTGGDETGGGDADLNEDQGVDGRGDGLGGQGDVEAAAVAGDVLDAVLAEPGDGDGLQTAGLGDGGQLGLLCLGQLDSLRLAVGRTRT